MSSPFETFRKHRTFWMAGLVMLAILAFIVAPGIESFMDVMRSNAMPGNQVVVRWSDGKITTEAVEKVRTQHARTKRFLEALAREVIKAGGMPRVPGFLYNPNTKRVDSLGLALIETNRAVCQTIMISHKAQQLGIELDDQVIEDYIYRFCDRKISPQRFQEILKETNGRDLTQPGLYRQLSLELSAVVMERLVLAGINVQQHPVVTPGSLWQNYLKLSQAARVEAFPILTSQFVDAVQEKPSESEIRALYEAGANVFPSPENPNPGFRRHYQADVQYVYGSFNQLIEAEKAKLTTEVLKAEYDRLVSLGGLQVPVEPAKPEDATASPPDAGQPPAPGQPSAPGATEAQAKPAEQPADTPTAAATQAEEKPAEEKPAEEKPAEEKPAEEKPAAEPRKQSRLEPASNPLRLVSFRQEPPTAAPAAAESKPAGQPVPPAETAPATGTDAAPGAPAAASPPMRTRTFEEAKDDIARSLAMRTVSEQVEAKLVRIESEMKRYSQERQLERIRKESQQKSDKVVTPVDLKKLAEAEGLNYGTTGMSGGAKLSQLPIGRSMFGNTPLVNVIMTPVVDLYQPVRSALIDMSSLPGPDYQQFVSWKVEDIAPHTPELAEIRPEVEGVWKSIRARQLAREEAEKLADKLRKAGTDPWKSTLTAEQQSLVSSPMPFTWMTSPRQTDRPSSITFVEGLDAVGEAFMQQVFQSGAGQFVVVPNQGQTTFYVVRVLETTPSTDQLRQNFEVSRGRSRQLVRQERYDIFNEWYRNVERTWNVQWLADPEQLGD